MHPTHCAQQRNDLSHHDYSSPNLSRASTPLSGQQAVASRCGGPDPLHIEPPRGGSASSAHHPPILTPRQLNQAQPFCARTCVPSHNEFRSITQFFKDEEIWPDLTPLLCAHRAVLLEMQVSMHVSFVRSADSTAQPQAVSKLKEGLSVPLPNLSDLLFGSEDGPQNSIDRTHSIDRNDRNENSKHHFTDLRGNPRGSGQQL